MTSKEFLMNLPEKINSKSLEGMNAIFHFDLEGEGGGQVSISITNGEVKVADGFVGEPNCTIKATNDNFKKVLKGDLNPMMAILTGKLKISNQSEMMKFAKLLGWM